MDEQRVSVTMGGELAAAIQEAAKAEGIRPSAWVVRTVSRSLSGKTQDAPGARQQVDWEDVTDPSGLLTATLPRGWRHAIDIVHLRTGPLARMTTTSPDGATTIICGDPMASTFLEPGPMSMFSEVPTRPATPADAFAAWYLQQQHGGRPGFRLIGAEPSPAMQERSANRARQAGFPLQWLTAVEASAEFHCDSGPVRVLALVSTCGGPGMWIADVNQIITSGEPRDFADVAWQVLSRVRPTELGRQQAAAIRGNLQAQHAATMQQLDANSRAMTQQHQANMRNIQASGAAHQQRMADLHATQDAQLSGWMQQQAQADTSHAAYMGQVRQETPFGAAGGRDQHFDFLNAMREERTVVDADGYDRQVAAGPDKFYHRTHDDSFIGLEQHQDIHDVPGIDPDDYYETPIRS